jgi:hypothetical protein
MRSPRALPAAALRRVIRLRNSRNAGAAVLEADWKSLMSPLSKVVCEAISGTGVIDIGSRRIVFWKGEKGRTLKMYKPCSCGCDSDRAKNGYLSGSDAQGNGFTLYCKSKSEFDKLQRIFG